MVLGPLVTATKRTGVVKSTERQRRLRALWSSTEPYRDGLTYREWQQRNGKAQRDRELAAQRAVDPDSEGAAAGDAPAGSASVDASAPIDAVAAGHADRPAEEERPASSSAPAAVIDDGDDADPKARRRPWHRTRAR